MSFFNVYGIVATALTSLIAGIALLAGEPLAATLCMTYAVTTGILTTELPKKTTQ